MNVYYNLVNSVNPVGDTPADCQPAKNLGQTQRRELVNHIRIRYNDALVGNVAQVPRLPVPHSFMATVGIDDKVEPVLGR